QELHERISGVLPVPDYYGMNLDAFFDVLSTYYEKCTIIFRNWVRTAYILPDYINKLKKVCTDIERENPDVRIIFEEESEERSPDFLDVLSNTRLLETADNFHRLMMYYSCAIMEVETKLNVLNKEFSLQYDRNPIETIKSRLKSPESIISKLSRKGLDLDIDVIEKELTDIAGLRVICSFQEDIYKLATMLASQDDVSLMVIKDYIKNPKPNGYRSLHLIIATPIFLSEEKRYMKVEVQFRTIAMDFWASLEHKMKYKKDIRNPEEISRRLKECADAIKAVDDEMSAIRNLIEKE
ncbi:MAG: barstar family protein, partial [Lachnospiraceae bacterium]